MKFIDKKISDTYFQIYILIDSKEKKNIINLVKNDLLVFEKEQLQEQIELRECLLFKNHHLTGDFCSKN